MTKRQPKRITKQRMLTVGFKAFRELARRWKLTTKEQANLLAISTSTLARWRHHLPAADETKLLWLPVVLLTYRRLLEITCLDDAETARVLRQEGSADNPAVPSQSLLDALSDRSVHEMERRYQRLAALIHAS